MDGRVGRAVIDRALLEPRHHTCGSIRPDEFPEPLLHYTFTHCGFLFRWNIVAFQKVSKKKVKSTDLLAQYQSPEFDQRFFTRLLRLVDYLQDKPKVEEIFRKCCNVLGKGCCLNLDSLYLNKELERLNDVQQLQVFEECLKSLPFVENTQGGGVRKIVDAKKLKAAEHGGVINPKPTRIITSPRSFTDCCTAFWMRSITIAHIHAMGGKVMDSEKALQWLESLNQGKHDSILLGEVRIALNTSSFGKVQLT